MLPNSCLPLIYILHVPLMKVVHTCGGGSKVVNKYSFIKYSALCSNGTIYSQEIGVSCLGGKVVSLFCRLATGGTWLTVKAQKSITSTRLDLILFYYSVYMRIANLQLKKHITEQHPG